MPSKILRYIEVTNPSRTEEGKKDILQYGPYANKRVAEAHLREKGWYRILPANPSDNPGEYSQVWWVSRSNDLGFRMHAKVRKLEMQPRNLLPHNPPFEY